MSWSSVGSFSAGHLMAAASRSSYSGTGSVASVDILLKSGSLTRAGC